MDNNNWKRKRENGDEFGRRRGLALDKFVSSKNKVYFGGFYRLIQIDEERDQNPL